MPAPVALICQPLLYRKEGTCREILESAGFEVRFPQNGGSVLTEPQLHAELDGIDGSQVCKISRAQDNLLPFIVVAREGEAAGFDALELLDDAVVVNRPVNLTELHAAVLQLAGEP